MDLLQEKLGEDPQAEEIDLEYNALTDLTELLPVLAQFGQLRVLHLASNRLTELPADLSMLATLEEIDLSDNLITNASALASSLLTLPSLSELQISSLTAEGLSYLRRKLPEVEIIPGAERQHEDIVEVGTVEDEEDAQDNLDQFQREDLEAVAGLFDDIKEFEKKECKGKVDSSIDFDEYVNSLGLELREDLKSAKTIAQSEVRKLRTRRRLFDSCVSELEAATNTFHPELSTLWMSVIRATEKCFDESLAMLEQSQQRDVTPKSEFENIEEGKEPPIESGPDLERLRKEWLDEKLELESEIESLKEENKKYLDVIIRHSKTSAETALRSNPPLSPEARHPSALSFNSPARSLSLKQLKEFIDEIYQAKVKFDQRCMESRLPIETLADFLNTHLTHKFGLKSLRQEWIAGVWQAVDRYSDEDNDVAVFGKVLRSECDEEFRFVQTQVKETATQLLRLFLREKNPLKTASGIESMLRSRVEGQLAEDEWMHVVTYMYNQTDSMLLVSLIRDMVQQRTITSPQSSKQLRLSREEIIQNRERERIQRSRIAYSDLLKILLDFQLKGHEKFLQGFLRRFRAADNDADGYINEFEFRQLAESMEMNFSAPDLERLLQLVDPFDYQKINFSQCVSLFTNVM